MGNARRRRAKFLIWRMHWEGVPPGFAPDFGRGTPPVLVGFLVKWIYTTLGIYTTGGIILKPPPSTKPRAQTFGEIWAKLKTPSQQFENFGKTKNPLIARSARKIGFWSDIRGETVQNVS